MECPSCQATVPEGGRFCMECGAPLPRTCPTCANLIPAAAKFCPECGVSLTGDVAAPGSSKTTLAVERPTPAPASSAERRQLTVMFIDLVGSTELSAQLDPEEMGDVLRAYQDAVAGAVARFEGHIAKLMGDGVLAYFGWPQAHEDEAERAVRAGLHV
jgi:Double zinc ribbon/Adenylate and Guanylate cyclase catalytic domain